MTYILPGNRLQDKVMATVIVKYGHTLVLIYIELHTLKTHTYTHIKSHLHMHKITFPCIEVSF
jgi:hypothetical protein